MRLVKREVGEKNKTMNINSGDFLFLSMKMQILRSLAKQEDISDSERQNAGDLIIDLEESIKPMSAGIKSITFDKNSNVRKITFAPKALYDARDFLFTLMKGQLLKSLRKESEEIKNPEILNIDNLLVNLDKSIRRMGTSIKAIILDKDLNVKKVEFAPASETPHIAPKAPYIKEETPEIKREIKKQESNRWLLERIAPENMQRLNMSTGLRREREKEREREMFVASAG